MPAPAPSTSALDADSVCEAMNDRDRWLAGSPPPAVPEWHSWAPEVRGLADACLAGHPGNPHRAALAFAAHPDAPHNAGPCAPADRWAAAADAARYFRDTAPASPAACATPEVSDALLATVSSERIAAALASRRAPSPEVAALLASALASSYAARGVPAVAPEVAALNVSYFVTDVGGSVRVGRFVEESVFGAPRRRLVLYSLTDFRAKVGKLADAWLS